jgi:hypothetical protein
MRIISLSSFSPDAAVAVAVILCSFTALVSHYHHFTNRECRFSQSR